MNNVTTTTRPTVYGVRDQGDNAFLVYKIRGPGDNPRIFVRGKDRAQAVLEALKTGDQAKVTALLAIQA